MAGVRFLALLVLFVFCSVMPTHAALMTFEAIPGNLDEITAYTHEISSYTEDGITLFAVNGPPDHFHDNFNPVNGTTGVDIFSFDGSPQRIIFNAGATAFSLISLDVWAIDTGSGPITLTSSSGATQLISTAETILFGSGFRNISFAQIDVPDPDADRYISLDNIQVEPVPEPGTLMLLSLGLGGVALVRCRARHKAGC